jgi:hypothetical protein
MRGVATVLLLLPLGAACTTKDVDYDPDALMGSGASGSGGSASTK